MVDRADIQAVMSLLDSRQPAVRYAAMRKAKIFLRRGPNASCGVAALRRGLREMLRPQATELPRRHDEPVTEVSPFKEMPAQPPPKAPVGAVEEIDPEEGPLLVDEEVLSKWFCSEREARNTDDLCNRIAKSPSLLSSAAKAMEDIDRRIESHRVELERLKGAQPPTTTEEALRVDLRERQEALEGADKELETARGLLEREVAEAGRDARAQRALVTIGAYSTEEALETRAAAIARSESQFSDVGADQRWERVAAAWERYERAATSKDEAASQLAALTKTFTKDLEACRSAHRSARQKAANIETIEDVIPKLQEQRDICACYGEQFVQCVDKGPKFEIDPRAAMVTYLETSEDTERCRLIAWWLLSRGLDGVDTSRALPALCRIDEGWDGRNKTRLYREAVEAQDREIKLKSSDPDLHGKTVAEAAEIMTGHMERALQSSQMRINQVRQHVDTVNEWVLEGTTVGQFVVQGFEIEPDALKAHQQLCQAQLKTLQSVHEDLVAASLLEMHAFNYPLVSAQCDAALKRANESTRQTVAVFRDFSQYSQTLETHLRKMEETATVTRDVAFASLVSLAVPMLPGAEKVLYEALWQVAMTAVAGGARVGADALGAAIHGQDVGAVVRSSAVEAAKGVLFEGMSVGIGGAQKGVGGAAVKKVALLKRAGDLGGRLGAAVLPTVLEQPLKQGMQEAVVEGFISGVNGVAKRLVEEAARETVHCTKCGEMHGDLRRVLDAQQLYIDIVPAMIINGVKGIHKGRQAYKDTTVSENDRKWARRRIEDHRRDERLPRKSPHQRELDALDHQLKQRTERFKEELKRVSTVANEALMKQYTNDVSEIIDRKTALEAVGLKPSGS